MGINDATISLRGHTASTCGVVQRLYTFSDEFFQLSIRRLFTVTVKKFVLEVEVGAARDGLLFDEFQDETEAPSDFLDVFRGRKIPYKK